MCSECMGCCYSKVYVVSAVGLIRIYYQNCNVGGLVGYVERTNERTE